MRIGIPRLFVWLGPWFLGIRIGPWYLRAGWDAHTLYSDRLKGRSAGWHVWVDRDRAPPLVKPAAP